MNAVPDDSLRRVLRRGPTFLFTLALMSALGGSIVVAEATRPFSEIQASPITVSPDPSGQTAVIEVDTAIDVACSIVYGTDESFGSIAVDSDMDGGAHAAHHPVLGGLAPETTYLYRLQGAAADGTLYVSEVMSFTMPPAAEGPQNLALGATVTGVSSEWSEAFAAGNAFDGDASTEWSSRGDGDEAWVEIDLGETVAISAIVFRSRSMNDGTARTTQYALTADGTAYGPFEADETIELEPLSARVMRFDVEASTGGNTGAVEILVLAAE